MELAIFEAMNLKDKRRALKSLKDRIRNGFNVSVAEVDDNDLHRQAVLGIVMTANDSRFIQSALSQIVELVRTIHNVTLIDYTIEML